MRQCLSHTCVCQKTSKQWAEICEAWPLVPMAAPLLFRWGPEESSAEAVEALFSSCATRKNRNPARRRTWVLIPNHLRWTPVTSTAQRREQAEKTASSLGSGSSKTYRASSSKGIASLCLCRYCTLEHMLLGDKEDAFIFKA